MYVIALHDIINPEAAFPRGQALLTGEGAPPATRVLQFLPSTDGTHVTCIWETPSVGAVQEYVDRVLGDSSNNACYPVDDAQAFAERPLGLRSAPAFAS